MQYLLMIQHIVACRDVYAAPVAAFVAKFREIFALPF